MTELLVICALAALGFAAARAMGATFRHGPAAHAELVQAGAVVHAAALSFLRRTVSVGAAVAAVLGALVFLSYGVAYQLQALSESAHREHGVVATVGYAVGAIVALAGTSVGLLVARDAMPKFATALTRTRQDALIVGIRAGAAAGLASQALAVLGVAVPLLATLACFGGSFGDGARALGGVLHVPMLLTGLPLGGLFVALLAVLGCGMFAKVADVAADVAGKLDASLPEDTDKSPATVADLAGDVLGDVLAQGTYALALTMLEVLGAMLVAAMLARDNASIDSAAAVILMPLVVRACGLATSYFGALVVRTDDTEVPASALARGLYVATLLQAAAAMGSAKWLLGTHWWRFGLAAAIGGAASVASWHVAQYYGSERHRPVRTIAEAARAGAAVATLRGFVLAAEAALVAAFLVFVAIVLGHTLGAATELAHGGLFGVALTMTGLAGAAPFAVAMHTMSGLADGASGLLGLTMPSERADVHARARDFGALGATLKAYSRTSACARSSVAVLVSVAAFVALAASAARANAPASLLPASSAVAQLGGVLGLALALGFVRLVLGRVVTAIRELVLELRHQLGGTEEAGALEPTAARQATKPLGEGAAPSRGDGFVELVTRAALRGTLPPLVIGVGLPLAMGVGLRWWAGRDRVLTSAEALAAFVLLATIVGALGSLLSFSAKSGWDNAKRYIETGAHGGRYVPVRNAEQFPGQLPPGVVRGSGAACTTGRGTEERDNPTYVAAVIGDTIGDPLAGVVAPSLQVLLATLVSLVLAFLPLFL